LSIKIFVRQPFTQTGAEGCALVQGVLNAVLSLDGRPYHLIITGTVAQSEDAFRSKFQQRHALPFAPQAFRSSRFHLLGQADAMLIVRTCLSESGAFEVAYNIFGGKRIPMFFAIWSGSPIRTTLIVPPFAEFPEHLRD
jgi:carbamoyl-phosphate synthase large subunit